MSAIEAAVASVMEDRRSSTLFNVKLAADAVNCHPRKFGQEWSRRQDWLLRLAVAQPGQLAAEFTAIIARAIEIRERAVPDNPARQGLVR